MYSKMKIKLKIAFMFLCGFIVLLAYQNCSGSKKDEPTDAFSSEQDIAAEQALTILATKCSSCHNSEIKGGGIDVLNLDEMLAKGVVVPNEPLLSLLFTEMQSGRMPPSGSLSNSDLQAVSDWIALGFKTAPVIGPLPPGTSIPLAATFSSINANILKTKCLGCHNSAKSDGGVSFSTYISTMNTVQKTLPMSSSLYVSVAIEKSMPRGGAMLSAAESKAIFDWITAGAANN